MNLAQRTESLFESLESSVRRAIRKAEQACLKVEFSNTPEAMATYYQLHCHTRKHHGLPPQPFQFFRKIQEHLLSKNHGIVVVARLNTQAVAAAVYLQHGSKAVYKFGASLKDVLDTRANNLVMWKAIQWLAEKGCTELTFGRTSLHHEGLRRFKLGWGTEEYAINYFKYDLKQKRVVAETDQSAGWYNTVFRHLPIPAGRLAGRLLYRHVA
ncbi:MAG: GNAT family N-acetyltransferase [Verrucomicrobiota bacterium]